MAKTNSKGFQYVSKKCRSINGAELKEDIFLGPQIREILEDEAFAESD
jgi:hypothetical protein